MKSSSTLSKTKEPTAEPSQIRIRHKQGDKWSFLWASSRTPDDPGHLIDLEAFNLNGKCDCMHFTTRLAKEAKRQQLLPTAQRVPQRCAHIKAAREWFTNTVLKRMADEMDRKSHPHNTHD